MQTVVFLTQTHSATHRKWYFNGKQSSSSRNMMKEYTKIKINVTKGLCLVYIQEPHCKGLHKTPHQQTEGILQTYNASPKRKIHLTKICFDVQVGSSTLIRASLHLKNKNHISLRWMNFRCILLKIRIDRGTGDFHFLSTFQFYSLSLQLHKSIILNNLRIISDISYKHHIFTKGQVLLRKIHL